MAGASVIAVSGTAPVPGRNGAVDCARFAGAAGIVWFHSGAPGAWLALSALPMFTILLVHFALANAPSRLTASFVRRRARRLLVPWLGWSVVYATARVAEAMLDGSPPAAAFEAWMLATGPAIHLWFLPFAFAASLVAVPLARLGRGGLAGATGVTIALSLSVPLSAVAVGSGAFGVPAAQWVSMLPAVLFGVLLHVAGGLPARLGALAALVLGVVVVSNLAGWHHGTEQFLLGGLAVLACLAAPVQDWPRVRALGGLSLGVYLAHPLVAAVLARGWHGADGTAAFALATLAGATLLAWAMRRTPVLRRIV